MKSQIVKYLFFALALIEFYAEFVVNRELIFFTKPLLMPLLALYFFFSIEGSRNKVHNWILAALFFSWIGDVSLMMTPETEQDVSLMGIAKNKYYFFIGLIAFFVGHVFYISVYLTHIKEGTFSLFRQSKLYFTPILIHTVAMLAIVVPAVFNDPEKSIATVPVIFYAMMLASMVGFALNRYNNTNMASFKSVLIGSVLFLISDSLIALNFLVMNASIPHGSLMIITTYVAAQFLIVDGVLKHYQLKG
jgi:uncharacterized membrane protein YhhN